MNVTTEAGSTDVCGESKAPEGWWCRRELGHEGPCAAVQVPFGFGAAPGDPRIVPAASVDDIAAAEGSIAWECTNCGQLNSGWATHCGRCEKPMPILIRLSREIQAQKARNGEEDSDDRVYLAMAAFEEIEWLEREYLGSQNRLGVALFTKADAESMVAVALAADRAHRLPAEPAAKYPAIWLRKEEEHRFIVAVEVGKQWVDVIREFDGGGGMSHIVEPLGIQHAIDGNQWVTP